MSHRKSDSEAKGRVKSEARRKLPFLLEFGNEDDIVAYAKAWNPAISSEQLERVIKLFRDAKREREHDRPPR